MRITIKKLRKLIREAIADTMMSYTEAPPNSNRAYTGSESQPSLRGNPNTDKGNMVAKTVQGQVGNTSHDQRVKQFVSQMDPQDKLVKTADEIAQMYLQGNKTGTQSTETQTVPTQGTTSGTKPS